MSDDFTPTEEEIILVASIPPYGHPEEEVRRGIAKIRSEAKAEGLREAAREIFDTMLPAECARYLDNRADQIEKEARNGLRSL